MATRSESDSQRWCAAQYGVHRKVDVRQDGVCTRRPSAVNARVWRYLVRYTDGRLGQAVTMPGEQQVDVYVRREPRGGESVGVGHASARERCRCKALRWIGVGNV